MTSNVRAFMWGAVAGAAASGVFALFKAKRLRARGLLVRTALYSRGDDLSLYLAAQGDELRDEIEEVARVKGESLARFTAEQVVANEYFLGSVTVEQLTRLDQAHRILRREGYL